jgi:hypothetical protein
LTDWFESQKIAVVFIIKTDIIKHFLSSINILTRVQFLKDISLYSIDIDLVPTVQEKNSDDVCVSDFHKY